MNVYTNSSDSVCKLGTQRPELVNSTCYKKVNKFFERHKLTCTLYEPVCIKEIKLVLETHLKMKILRQHSFKRRQTPQYIPNKKALSMY